MKKILFTILCAGAVMSCAKEEVITANQEAITFENAFVNNATKAIDGFTVTKDNLATFNVWGTTQMPETGSAIVPIFAEVAVSGSGSAWSYDAGYTQYWIPGNTYVFAAAKNYDGFTIKNGVPSTFTVDAENQKDLLYATKSQVGQPTGSNTAVAFDFEHLLSKVYFTVQNTITTNVTGNVYAYRVTDIKITNAYQDGTYYVVADGTNAAKSWAVSTPDAVEFSKMTAGVDEAPIVVGKVSAADEATSYYARLVIPAAYTALNVTCKVETLLNGAVVDVQDYNKTVAHTFVKGNSYNFVLSKGLPGEKIEFTVNTVKDWTENTVSSYPSL